MVHFRVRMHIDDSRREAVVRSLMRILGPTRAEPGCINCQLSADLEDANTLVFAEEWADQDCLAQRLRGESLRVLLAAMDCAVEPPDVRIDAISDSKGIEWIASCRSAEASN